MSKTILYIFLGGGLGSVLRYLFSILIQNTKHGFPFATFLVNVLGSFLIGILLAYFQKNNIENNPLTSFLVIGFCGGFTTFSTFSKESILLFQQQQYSMFLIYVFASILICFLATFIGFLAFKN